MPMLVSPLVRKQTGLPFTLIEVTNCSCGTFEAHMHHVDHQRYDRTDIIKVAEDGLCTGCFFKAIEDWNDFATYEDDGSWGE